MSEGVWRELSDRAFLHGELPVFRALVDRGHPPVVALRAVMTPDQVGASVPAPDPSKAAKQAYDEAAEAYSQHARACPRCTLTRPRCDDGIRLLEAANVAWNAY